MWIKSYDDNSYWNSDHIEHLQVVADGSVFQVNGGGGGVFAANIATEAEAQAVLKKLAATLGCIDAEELA